MGKGLVKFNEEKCKGCELCIAVCPEKIISLHKTRINSKGYFAASIEEPEKCRGCGNCAVTCPDGVITIFLNEGR